MRIHPKNSFHQLFSRIKPVFHRKRYELDTTNPRCCCVFFDKTKQTVAYFTVRLKIKTKFALNYGSLRLALENGKINAVERTVVIDPFKAWIIFQWIDNKAIKAYPI